MRSVRALAVSAAVILLAAAAGGVAPLLTEADLPAGWTAETTVTGADVAMPTHVLCGGATLAARARRAGGTPDGRATFIADAFTGPVLTESIWSFPIAGRAAAFLLAARTATARCGAHRHVDRVSGARTSLVVTSAANGFGVSQRTDASMITTAGDSRYVRVGKVVVIVTLTGYVVDHALTEHLTELALAKVAGALG